MTPTPSMESPIARGCRQTGSTPDEVAGAVGVAPQSVYRAAVRGAARAAE